MARNGKRETSTVELKVETKRLLESIKLSDGEESWDHLLNRLYLIYAASPAGDGAGGTRPGSGLPLVPPRPPPIEA